MPLIEYRCEDCSSQFEILIGVSQEGEKAVCPDCGNERIEALLSTFSAKVSTSNGSPGPEMGACGTSACPCAN